MGRLTIDIPKKASTVSIWALKPDTCDVQSGTVQLMWTAHGGKDEQVTSIIRYTNDGGETWCPVVVGLEESEYVVDLDQLPGGSTRAEYTVQVPV